MKEQEQSCGGVVIVIYSTTHALIIIEPTRHDPRWKFPGGGIDSGESPLDAAKRELREETGIDMPPRAFWEFLPLTGTAGKHYFFVRVVDRRLKERAERGQDGEVTRLVPIADIEAMRDFLPEHQLLARLIPLAEKMREQK